MIDLAVAENLNPVVDFLYKPRFNQELGSDHCTRCEPIQVMQLDFSVHFLKHIGESPFGQPPYQRRLASFKVPAFAAAGTLALTLVTPSRSLAPTGSNTATYSFSSVRAAFCGFKFMNPHTYTPSD